MKGISGLLVASVCLIIAFRTDIVFGRTGSPRVANNSSSHGGGGGHGGIHVATWRYTYVQRPLLITIFVVLIAIIKICKYLWVYMWVYSWAVLLGIRLLKRYMLAVT